MILIEMEQYLHQDVVINSVCVKQN